MGQDSAQAQPRLKCFGLGRHPSFYMFFLGTLARLGQFFAMLRPALSLRRSDPVAGRRTKCSSLAAAACCLRCRRGCGSTPSVDAELAAYLSDLFVNLLSFQFVSDQGHS